MKAALISLGSESSTMVAKALKKYFQVDELQLKQVQVHLGKESGVLYQGNLLPDYDCVYLKGSFRYANLLSSIAALLESKVAYMPLASGSFAMVHNKILTHIALQQYRIPQPRTYVTSSIEGAQELLKTINYPIVMKFPEGTQGKGVMFADSLSSASSLLDALGVLKQPFLLQEYIETDGTDIRALVIGEKVVAAMRRKAQTDEKRANIHAGGTGVAMEVTRELTKIAVDTAKALGAEICGVDILETQLGLQVIEANISPGLQGLSKVTSLDLAGEIAKFLYKKTQEALSKKAQGVPTMMKKNGSMQEIISTLQLRGDRLILPEIVNRIAGFDDHKEYVIKAGKGKIEIEEK